MEERGGKIRREGEIRELKKIGRKREILCLWGPFSACPVALGWIYALDLEECVYLYVYGANRRVYVDREPEATGQSNHTQTCLESWDTERHTHFNLAPLSSFIFSFTQPPHTPIFSTLLNTSAITN